MLVKSSEEPIEPNDDGNAALSNGREAHKRSFKNPFGKNEKKKGHSLFYRLFHNSEDEEQHHADTSMHTLKYSDSESDVSGTPGTPRIQEHLEKHHDVPFSALPPPLLVHINDLKSNAKSSSSLANFFKKEINKKVDTPKGFLFSHLKTSERIEAELVALNTRLSHADISPVLSPSNYACASIPAFKAVSRSSVSTLNPVFDNSKRNTSELSLSDKYGWVEKKCIGKGANGVVKVSHKQDVDCEKLYAIKVESIFFLMMQKEFRKKHKDESDKSFIKKLTSEFCIGSSLHHENVVETIDLIKNDNQQWCEVLEYCGGGDLCNVIQNKHLTADEVNTFFLQLIHGVAYIHGMGVSHRDLKPENLVLDSKGRLKIADFGEAEVFRNPYEKTSHKSKRCCGSEPYMAPEEFTLKEFDSVPIDIFACGVIYLAMTYNRLPWRKPTMDDSNFKFYCSHLKNGFAFLDRLAPGPRDLMRRVLHPDPELRASMDDILGDVWFMGIELEYKEKGKCGSL